jgi:hypothetical protein
MITIAFLGYVNRIIVMLQQGAGLLHRMSALSVPASGRSSPCLVCEKLDVPCTYHKIRCDKYCSTFWENFLRTKQGPSVGCGGEKTETGLIVMAHGLN